MPEGNDKWWEVRANEQTDPLAVEVMDAIISWAVPAMENPPNAQLPLRAGTGHPERVGRPAHECFVVDTNGAPARPRWRWVLFRLQAFLLGDYLAATLGRRLKRRLTIRELPSERVVFDDEAADFDVVELAKRDLAALDEDDFRRRWDTAT